jgi:hypothetical protein
MEEPHLYIYCVHIGDESDTEEQDSLVCYRYGLHLHDVPQQFSLHRILNISYRDDASR